MPLRAAKTRERLIAGVVAVLSEVGMGGITHRRVAAAAKVSLSATTYHYDTKNALVTDASKALLKRYLESFAHSAEIYRESKGSCNSLTGLAAQLALNAVGLGRAESIAWCEIILDAARTPDGHKLASEWFGELAESWRAVAAAMGEKLSWEAIQAVSDTTIGLYFIILALGLGEKQVEALWLSDDPCKVWGIEANPNIAAEAEHRFGRKALETRSKIIGGAIRILNRDGAGAVTYRNVAAESGVALTAPAYYFSSIDDLMRVAEGELFRASKERYRAVAALSRSTEMTPAIIADMSATILIKEATEFRLPSAAFYSLWLQAARSSALRPEVAGMIVDQATAWQRRAAILEGISFQDGIFFQALFIGILVRAMASGAPIEVLMETRAEFFEVLTHRRWPSLK